LDVSQKLKEIFDGLTVALSYNFIIALCCVALRTTLDPDTTPLTVASLRETLPFVFKQVIACPFFFDVAFGIFYFDDFQLAQVIKIYRPIVYPVVPVFSKQSFAYFAV
jgi:hypothetical protein